MRVLQVSSLFLPHIGGIENHVNMLSNKLVQDGHKVTIFTSNIPFSNPQESLNGIKVFRYKCLGSPLNNQITPGLYANLLNAKDFDVLHVHSHLHLSSNFAVLSKKFNKLPIVLTSHGTVNYEGCCAVVENIYNSTILKWMLKSVEKIIALTNTQAQILETLGADRKRISIIPNGIDLNNIHILDQPHFFGNLKNFKNSKIILYVGSLIPRKGISYLIEAMKYVDADAVLLIAGRSIKGNIGYDKTLKSQAKSLGLKNIVFLGKVTNEELEHLYNMADIFVLPSLSEGLPYTLIEAMSYKKCVIATNIAGNCDVIRNMETGILIDSKDPWELSDKINFLIGHEKLRFTLGISARTEVESRYDLNKIYQDTKKLYLECL